MDKRAWFSKRFCSERVNESQKFLKKTFIRPFHQSGSNWVRKSYFESSLKFQDCLLTGWLPNTSILVVIERIYRCQFKSNYLKNHKLFPEFFLAFLESTLNFQCSEKNNEPHRSNISEVIDSERCAYLNA